MAPSPPSPTPPPPSPPPPEIKLSWNGTGEVDVVIIHRDETKVVFDGPGAQMCDVAVWVRLDYSDHHIGQECNAADYFINLATNSLPQNDHGGHIEFRPDVGNFTEVVLSGIHDSDDILLDDPELEKTGTYAEMKQKLCEAPDHEDEIKRLRDISTQHAAENAHMKDRETKRRKLCKDANYVMARSGHPR